MVNMTASPKWEATKLPKGTNMTHTQSDINRQVISMMQKHGNCAEEISSSFAFRFFTRNNDDLCEYWLSISAKICCVQNKHFIQCLYGTKKCGRNCYRLIH